MSRFDDELCRAAEPLAEEPLPNNLLDETLENGPTGRRSFIQVGTAVATLALVMVGVGVGGRILGLGIQPSLAPSPTSAVASESSTPSPATTKPTPTFGPVEPMVATVEKDGIRLTLDVDRNRVAFEQRVWATVTIENIGSDAVYWGHSSTCRWAGSVQAEAEDSRPLPYGRTDWGGELAILKTVTVRDEGTQWFFTPEVAVDFEGNWGCTSDLVVSELLPAGRMTSRFAWDTVGPHGMPPRPGVYTVAATFDYMGRGTEAPDLPPDTREIGLQLPLDVDGVDIDYVAPGEAVDRLFADESFLSALVDAPRDRWAGSEIWYGSRDTASGSRAWVFMLQLEPDRAIHATIDPVNGDVLSVDKVIVN
jgi:hypothetical protein